MLTKLDRDNLHRIVVVNPKGGSGKTTLATNIAGYYAVRGPAPTLLDCDPQGFSMRWLDKRPGSRPQVYGIAANAETGQGIDFSNLQVRPDSEKLIIDSPAGLSPDDLFDVTYDAGSILIPVQPSEIDVFCASRFIAELLLGAQIDRRDSRLAIVANRTRQNTRSYRMLMRFLTSLRIPIIAVLRDSQNFVHAAADGISIHELPAYKTKKDIAQMDLIVNWLDRSDARGLYDRVSTESEHGVVKPLPLLSEIPMHLKNPS